jgi:hypothetical protein
MTAAHEQRLSERRRLRLQSLCEVKRQNLTGKRQRQWKDITKEINRPGPDVFVHLFDRTTTPEQLAGYWRSCCEVAEIGIGFWSFLFWRYFLPLLIELAKEWLRENQAEESTVTISGVASGAATNISGS